MCVPLSSYELEGRHVKGTALNKLEQYSKELVLEVWSLDQKQQLKHCWKLNLSGFTLGLMNQNLRKWSPQICFNKLSR